jgi:Na+/phosphate symporter
MHNETESSQKIQELARQLEQISKQVKKTIGKTINESFPSEKTFFSSRLQSSKNQIELKEAETESIYFQLKAADTRIAQDLLDIGKYAQETRDLLAKLKAEVA